MEVLCPFCNTPMLLRNGKRGQFYGCRKFPTCRGTRDLIIAEPSPNKLLIKGSPEQEAIWHWLQHGTENGVIDALAGVGKSFTIVNSISRLRGIKIGVFSFNTHIIREMNDKLLKEGISWAKGHTFNAFGYRCVKNAFPNVELFAEKLPTLLSELVPQDTDEGATVRQAANKLVRLCKCYMEDGTDQETLLELMERFNIDVVDDLVDKVFEVVPRALDLCVKRRSTLDFDDQVYWVVKMNLPVERFDMVMIDEAQDTNRMQQKLIEMVCP